jgi:mRNA-degrading endonuclease RelE of RelBE toxin-antitoxin system
VTPLQDAPELQDAPDIVLTPNSSVTLQSASDNTRALILAAFKTLDENDRLNTERVEKSGHYVSRVGEARIVWMRDPDTRQILVLTIYSPIP